MQKSFTEYCRSYLFDAIQARVRDYVEGRGYELQDVEISFVNVYSLPGLKIGFDAAVEYSYAEYDRYEDESRLKKDMFMVQGRLDLEQPGALDVERLLPMNLSPGYQNRFSRKNTWRLCRSCSV